MSVKVNTYDPRTPPTQEELEQAETTLCEYAQRDRTGEEWAVAGTLSAEFREWLRPMLMSQRRALLMQVEAIEKTLGIEPTTSHLRRMQKSGIIAPRDG